MNNSTWLKTLFAISSLCVPMFCVHAANQPASIKVLIIDGYSNHDWQRTTRLARGILEPTGLFEIAVSTAPASTNDP